MISPQEQLQIIFDKVAQTIKKKGPLTLRSLGKTFRSFDSFDRDGHLDRDEFYIGLKENGVELSKSQADLMLGYLDRNRDGTVNVEEFLVIMRGQLNDARVYEVSQIFRRLDIDGQGFVTVEDLNGKYDGRDHPKVIRGELTEDQAFLEFLQSFKNSTKSKRITYDEWREYYAAVSSEIERDDHFIELLRRTWRRQQ